MRAANPAIARETILSRAHDALRMVEQWRFAEDYQRAAWYQAKVEALVELVEVDDCGSVGGYDRARGQESPAPVVRSLRRRLEWLCSVPVPRKKRGSA